LAPLYDVASVLPYPALSYPETKLAMRLGGEYLLKKIGKRQWAKLAEALKLPAAHVVQRVEDLLTRTPAAAAKVAERAVQEGLTHDVLRRLADRLSWHVGECQRRLQDKSER